MLLSQWDTEQTNSKTNVEKISKQSRGFDDSFVLL
jgi:hypothetical protein